jgi:hypothetical protein
MAVLRDARYGHVGFLSPAIGGKFDADQGFENGDPFGPPYEFGSYSCFLIPVMKV